MGVGATVTCDGAPPLLTPETGSVAYYIGCEYLIPGLEWGRRRRDGVYTSLWAERGRRVGGGGGRIVAIVIDHGVLLGGVVGNVDIAGDGNGVDKGQDPHLLRKLHSQTISMN